MEGGDLEPKYQPRRVNKKVKKVENPPEDPAELIHEENDKNPFQNQVILDVVFKMLQFEEVKKFRLVSSIWNEVGTSELSIRPQKHIKFYDRGFQDDDKDKMSTLLQLQRRHNEVFPHNHNHQIFSSFCFSSSFLTILQFDEFFDNFSPRVVKLVGGTKDHKIRKLLCKFLVKISPRVQEIEYYVFHHYFKCESGREDYFQELISTSFPNLCKIIYQCCTSDLEELLFYSLIGQNSPKLRNLELNTISDDLGSSEYMKNKFEQADLMSKLQILELFDFEDRFNEEILKVFTEFGQNGVLKLRKLKIKQDLCRKVEMFKEIYVPLIAAQTETLRILKISTSLYAYGSPKPPPKTKVPFPSLQNLSILQIDDLPPFEACFQPINFSIQFPKLVEFRTCDIERFLAKNRGHDGDSVKSVTLFRNPSEERKKRNCFGIDKKKLDLNKLYKIFPNLEFMDLDIWNLVPSQDFSSQLKKVVIRCDLQDLYDFNQERLKGVKKVEMIVDCENKLIDEDTYKDYIGGFLMDTEGDDNSGYFNRNKFYKRFLDSFSEENTSLQNSVSITFFGHNIAEGFKRDFRAIFPHCCFMCSQFKSVHEEDCYIP